MKFFLTCVIGLISASYAWQVSDANTIMTIMKISPVVYKNRTLSAPIPVPDRTKLINYHSVYQVKKGDDVQVKSYQISEKAKGDFAKAEKAFGNRQLEEARTLYKKALLADPGYVPMMDYVAQSFGMERKFQEAELWYKKAIEQNYIDNLAHWMLADIYMLTNRKELALDEITIAKILNRNNPRLEKKFKEVYAANGLDTTSYTFNPQVQIFKTPLAVTVEADSVWLMYGLAKANWENEPDYSKGKTDYDKGMELLLAHDSYVRGRGMDEKLVKRMDMAMEKRLLEELFFYEIVLLDHPERALYQSKENLQRLKEYVIESRRK